MTGLADDDELLAAELAFGLIDGAERQAAERRLSDDPDFARAHGRWLAHAAALATGEGEAPRPSVWNAIASRLPANDERPPEIGSVRRWRTATAVASAAALVFGALALQKPAPVVLRVPVAQAPRAPMVAVLKGRSGVVTISVDTASGHLTTATSGLPIGDHAAELWAIPADGRPRSMGIISRSAPGWSRVPAAARAVLSAGVTIAVSVEPAGGSPTGLPTGPVILSGKLVAT